MRKKEENQEEKESFDKNFGFEKLEFFFSKRVKIRRKIDYINLYGGLNLTKSLLFLF